RLEEWLQYREEFSDEFIKHEALHLGDEPSPCQTCGDSNALFRCLNCFSCGSSCQSCLVSQHAHGILHRLQKWNGSFFDDTSLFELGVSHQLGHDINDPCSLPSAPVTLTLFDLSGVHTIRVKFCLCEDNGEEPAARRCQLLRARWFPATCIRPSTAFTFRLLDFLHKLQTQSKINLYDFYTSLVFVNNSAGQKPAVYRYNEFSLVLRIWVHLRQLRRGGGVHVSGGFQALAPGSLSVECPACPHPGKNLVSPQVDRYWLNTLYVSMDANFKLKQKERGFSDPPLSNGLAYMVPNQKLQEHLSHCSKSGQTGEINTCGSSFNAVSQAYTKYAKGYAVTGVGGVDCARHGFKRPNGVVDLQRGERYCNMDFALMSTLVPSLNAGITRILISYDIACQWHKNFQARLKTYNAFPPLQLSALTYWKVVVPKFHLPGHGQECQLSYNLAYTKWAGRTDGERIEAGWAQVAPMATWTRESGPNARRGILDDHWNAGNWSKTLKLRVALNRNLQRSVAWSTSQREVATLISGSYPAEIVAKWREMRANFDRDPSRPNPYKEVERHLTIAELQKELLKEAKPASDAHPLPVADARSSNVSPGTLFQKAIEVEDRIRVLSAKLASKVSTVRHQVDTLELRNSISRNLAEFRRSQRLFMPALGPILDEACDDKPTEDSFKLFLPSELSVDDRVAWCPPGTPALEFRFRYAQADDSLAEMRRLLRLKRNLRDENSKHLHMAQRSITRTKGLFESFHTRIHRFADRYSHARSAMLALDPDQQYSPGWMERYQKLDGKDICGPGREESDTSEGKFTPSWIWLVPRLSHPPPASTAASDLELTDSMRAHWAKCQARAERYEEEVLLTVEEMGRTLSYFEWKRSWWLSLQSEREMSDSPPPASVQRGLRAYAHRQANIYDTLIHSFADKWRETLKAHNLYPAWMSRYPATAHPHDHSQPGTEPNDDGDNGNNNDNNNDDDDDDDDGNNSDGDYVFDDADAFEFDLDDDFMA
ncbi:hypothetical protein BJ322DRAFT_1010483, partial [Thelephora terrestris]